MRLFYWRLVLMARKVAFLTVATFVRNAMFQTSLALVILSASYFLQVRGGAVAVVACCCAPRCGAGGDVGALLVSSFDSVNARPRTGRRSDISRSSPRTSSWRWCCSYAARSGAGVLVAQRGGSGGVLGGGGGGCSGGADVGSTGGVAGGVGRGGTDGVAPRARGRRRSSIVLLVRRACRYASVHARPIRQMDIGMLQVAGAARRASVVAASVSAGMTAVTDFNVLEQVSALVYVFLYARRVRLMHIRSVVFLESDAARLVLRHSHRCALRATRCPAGSARYRDNLILI